MGNKPYNLITILGPTAAGKTRLAALLASRVDGEVISADSRQVYRRMDLGTGKDYKDYEVAGKMIPFHLVDIVDPGYEYNVYEYQRDFVNAFEDIRERDKMPVLCGGSGLYLEAVLKGYRLINVPKSPGLRMELEGKTMEELEIRLRKYRDLHNITDITDRKRLIRAIEIGLFYHDHPEYNSEYPALNALIIGIKLNREDRRRRITERLEERLSKGMVQEVDQLLKSGIPPDKMIYYGLEYKYITHYLNGTLQYIEMVDRLNTAIHQFSKRQMTWFRRMDRMGTKIHWLDGSLNDEVKLEKILEWL
ncbi:MAG: tRNA dimethylallyltransferase [Bacteroides sp. SM23_62_1]|nr:MAG: tRNA dimethylallyltransferase [Bacteroides sp. SM23_62_1]